MSGPVTGPRVLVVDGQALFRSGLIRLLDRDERVVVVGEAGDGLEAVQKAISLRPDVVLMDVRMPNYDGIRATRRIRAECPDVKVLILTTLESDSFVVQAHKAGASGYILKDLGVDSIVSSVLAVVAGDWVMSAPVASRMLEMLIGVTEPNAFSNALTVREVEILTMLASGMANKQIADRLKISYKTVGNHISNMYDKLRIYDRSQAVLYAIRKGLISV